MSLTHTKLEPRDSSGANLVFARHETFHPRFGWLKKGFDAALKDPSVFSKEDCHILLGVGKNMGQSIRYWCTAFKLLYESENPGTKVRTFTPTGFGAYLLGHDGWDPYLENPSSLWLLHWNLLKPRCHATAWHFAFNIFRKTEFSSDDLFFALCDYRDRSVNRSSDSSLKKDVSCILRMYVEQDFRNNLSEDTIDCPFTELGIIHKVGYANRYVFQVGPKSSLSSEIIVSACLEFISLLELEQRTISISRLLFENSSPGLVFKLSESALCDAIERIALWNDSITLSDSAGLIQFSFTKDPRVLAQEIIEKHFADKLGESCE